MSTETSVNYQLLRLYIDTIPHFNGDNSTLEIFLEHCDHLIGTYTNANNQNDPLNSFLIRAVVSKQTGNALALVGSRPEIRNWNELKILLGLSFGDQRNLDCLVQELIIMKPHKNESFFNFGQRIQKARSAIASKLISMNLAVAERTFQIKNYDELCLKTFIRGLTGRVQDMVRLRNPDSLELAISYVLEEENFMLHQRQSGQSQNSSFTQNLQNRSQPQLPVQFSNHFNQPKIASFPRYPNISPQTRNTFPSQPINIQPRQNMPPPRFFTNQQVFGKQNFPPKNFNVFKPTGQVSQTRPEPMSTSTRNANFPRGNQNRNFFQSTGPRNFASQELHNLQDSDDFNYGDYSTYDQDFEHCNDANNSYSFNENDQTQDSLDLDQESQGAQQYNSEQNFTQVPPLKNQP
nr:unnamed protein product [Callosobruchus chinensis]